MDSIEFAIASWHARTMASEGWPADWNDRKAGRGCPMCGTLGGGDNEHTVHVGELAFTEVRLERRSRLPGYCVVVWKGRHVAEPTELDESEAAGYWTDVLDVARALERQFNPMQLNLLTL